MRSIRCLTAPAQGGGIDAIASKSELHRALIAASLSDRPSELIFRGISEDILATVRCLSALGADIQSIAGGYRVCRGNAPRSAVADAGESGSTLRFLIPIAAALGVDVTFVGHGRLGSRPLSPLVDQLALHGARIEGQGLPLRVCGRPSGGRYELAGNISSQFITGLLLALPMLGKASEIVLTTPLESAPYVDLTISVLRDFGVLWQREENAFRLVEGAAYRSPGKYVIEGDWSNAAFHLVLGALGEGVTVKGLDPSSLQADRAILTALTLAGAKIGIAGDEITVSRPERLSAFDFDVSACPDLFPVLSVLAAGANGESRLYGGERLRLKESDRIATTYALLTAIGADAKATDDGVIVRGGRRLSGGEVDGAGDHRIVMAAAVARSLCEHDLVIVGAEAVAKSYPDFFKDYAILKGESHEIEFR